MTNIPCQDLQDRIALAPQETSQKGTSASSSHKKGGTPKRKATELQGDLLLWAKLRAGTPITRNKRQEERLRQWKESVASEYEGCEALDERKIKCACGTVPQAHLILRSSRASFCLFIVKTVQQFSL